MKTNHYIPQAEQNDDSVDYVSYSLREYFSAQLAGDGIDIGPLHKPMIKHAGMNVKYVDRMDVAALRQHYPEFDALPLVRPDIISDAEFLDAIKSNSQNFVIAAHVIEHMSSPLGALKNWLRVLKLGGKLYLVVPDKRMIFDKSRVRTTLAHIVQDYKIPYLGTTGIAIEHFLDYAVHVDGKEDPEEAIKHAHDLMRKDYSIHTHVFLPRDVLNMLKWYSDNIEQIKILSGPMMENGGSECHFLVQKL